MIKGRPITAIIPAREGSKRAPGKNTRKLAGKTLLERTIELAQKAARIDRVVVSTDSAEMYRCAQGYGVAAPSLRPAALAADTATTVAVVEHLLVDAKIDDGFLLLLQVTSPLRTFRDLENILDLAEQATDADAVVSLCQHQGAHPEKMQIIQDGRVASFMGTDSHRPEQVLPEVYALNGAFYLVDSDLFRARKTFLPEATLPYVMPPERSVNIDTETDWQILDAMLSKGYWTLETLT